MDNDGTADHLIAAYEAANKSLDKSLFQEKNADWHWRWARVGCVEELLNANLPVWRGFIEQGIVDLQFCKADKKELDSREDPLRGQLTIDLMLAWFRWLLVKYPKDQKIKGLSTPARRQLICPHRQETLARKLPYARYERRGNVSPNEYENSRFVADRLKEIGSEKIGSEKTRLIDGPDFRL